MENSKGNALMKEGRLNSLESQLAEICSQFGDATTSIYSKVEKIQSFDCVEGKGESIEPTPTAISDKIEQHIRRLRGIKSELSDINSHLGNIIS